MCLSSCLRHFSSVSNKSPQSEHLYLIIVELQGYLESVCALAVQETAEEAKKKLSEFVSEDGEEIDGLSAELQESFGKIGVAIEDADGNLRSIYDIAKDYAKVLPTLTSEQKQYYAELAAGKRNVTTWNAITQQFQDAENATAQAIDSIGSASEENSKYLDSISGKVSQFQSATEQLSSTVVNSDLVKFFIDLGTTGVKSVDALIEAATPLGTLFAVGGGLLSGTKNVGRGKTFPLSYCFNMPTIICVL